MPVFDYYYDGSPFQIISKLKKGESLNEDDEV